MSEKITHIEFLDLVARGCTSGRFSEWQQLRPACEWAVQEIGRLHADAARYRFIREEAVKEGRHTEVELDAEVDKMIQEANDVCV